MSDVRIGLRSCKLSLHFAFLCCEAFDEGGYCSVLCQVVLRLFTEQMGGKVGLASLLKRYEDSGHPTCARIQVRALESAFGSVFAQRANPSVSTPGYSCALRNPS